MRGGYSRWRADVVEGAIIPDDVLSAVRYAIAGGANASNLTQQDKYQYINI